MGPNVLFIVADDLNSWIGALGRHPDVKTPHIDALAERGVLFTHAYCAAPYCNSSRMSVFTGCLPSTTGVYHDEPLWDRPGRRITFVERLREHGYYTFGAGKVFHGLFDYATAGRERRPRANWREVENRSHLWDDFRSNRVDPLPDDRPLNGLVDFDKFDSVPPAYHLFDWGPLPEDRVDDLPDAAVARAVAEFLRNPVREPFFCAAGFYKPHLPWYVPKRFFELYERDSLALPLVKSDDLDDVPPIPRGWVALRPDHELVTRHNQWRHAVHGYLASISYCDHVIGEVVDALDASGLADRTAIVLWGDNGFHLGEKLHWRKFALWEEATRVPLIVSVPLLGGQRRAHAPVSLIDVFPTILDVCGVEPEEGIDGESLYPLLERPGATRTAPAISTWGPGNHSARTAPWRLTRYCDGTDELYDHRVDPYEWTNLARLEAFDDVRAELRRCLPQDDVEAGPEPAEAPPQPSVRRPLRGRGPAWLGIGAQRAGTTWFTSLLLQHPEVRLSRENRKELHVLYRDLDGGADLERYAALFDTEGLPGEWTPYYLRAPWVPPLAASVCRPGAPILVLLRDPVERFASAMRFYGGRRAFEVAELDDAARTRLVSSDVVWAGMYATQLAAWAEHFDRDRLIVMQYEAVRSDPDAAVADVWQALGLEPVPLEGVDVPSRVSSSNDWAWPAGLKEALRTIYSPEVEQLQARWGVDRALWPNFR